MPTTRRVPARYVAPNSADRWEWTIASDQTFRGAARAVLQRRRKDRIYIVAEAGVNHNGDLARAIDMIEVAASAGADAVKFQTFCPEEVVSSKAPKAEYQMLTTDADESQLEMERKLVLDDDEHRALVARCREKDIDFLSTPFDLPSLEFLTNALNLGTIKIPSGEVTNAPLLLRTAQAQIDIILSTGMCTMDEVAEALDVIAYGFLGLNGPVSRQGFRSAASREDAGRMLKQRVCLLHCTTEYPAPFVDANLRAMDSMRDLFGLAVGFSDHTPGISISIAAAARGAAIIEKHFTLDRSLPGPDHMASLEPHDLQAMVTGIREVEEAMGDGNKRPMQSELKNMDIARKSLIARHPIRSGEAFTLENLAVKRPGSGVSPMDYWDWIGRIAGRDYAADDIIEP